jgi:hypothetical protein
MLIAFQSDGLTSELLFQKNDFLFIYKLLAYAVCT